MLLAACDAHALSNFWNVSEVINLDARVVSDAPMWRLFGRTGVTRFALATSLGAAGASLLAQPPLAARDLAASPRAPAGALSALVGGLRGAPVAMCAPSPSGSAEIIDGKQVAAEIRKELRDETDLLKKKHDIVPGLAVVLVGNRTDSATYVRMKKRAADEVGFHSVDKNFEDQVSEEELLACVRGLNNDPSVHAILVQLPLPRHIDESKVLAEISVRKDVDGFSAQNIGAPRSRRDRTGRP